MTEQPQLSIVPERKLQLDVSVWNYRDFMQFSKLTRKSASAAYRKAQEVIIEWDYDIPLSDENAIAKLDLEEGIKVVQSIMSTLSTAFEQLSTADVSVNFKRGGWNTLTVEKFLKALQNFDYAEIATMVHEVASVDGVKAGDTLPLAEGAMMVKAIRARYEDLLQGKF